MADERPQPMEFVRAEEQPQPTGRVAAVRVDETQLATITREEPPLPPHYQLAFKVADQFGEMFCLLLAYLALSHDKLTSDTFAMLAFGILGVNNSVRVLGGKARGAVGSIKPPQGLGAIALGFIAVGASVLHFFRGGSSHSGFARVRVMRDVALVAVLVLAASLLGCAGNSNGMEQALNGYSTFHTWAQRICGVLTTLPSPPTVRSFVGGDAGVSLDASVP